MPTANFTGVWGRRLAGCALPFLLAGSACAETLTLAQCLRETAAHNPSIIQQRSAIARAGADGLVLRSRALPQLAVSGIGGQLEQDTVGTRTRTKNKTTGVVTTTVTPTVTDTKTIAIGTEGLYQPLFDAAIPASFRRATAELLAEQENLYVVASAELHQTRTLFLQALYQQKSGEILHRVDSVLAADVRSVTQLADAGLAGQAGLLTAQVQRANFAPALLAASGTYKTTLARLLQTMGREPAVHGPDALDHITLAGTLGETLPDFDAAEATRRALARRPDLRNLRALVRANNEDANIARGGYFPLVRIYLDAEAVPQSNVRNNTPNAVRASDQVGVTELRPGIDENWTIIDPGTVRGAVRSARDARDIVAIGLARLERAIPADLAVVRARLADAASTSAALRGSADTSRKTLDIIQSGVNQGIYSQLEFLDAEGGVLGVEIGGLAADLEASLAHAEFDRITGNYIQFVDEPSSRELPSRTAKK